MTLTKRLSFLNWGVIILLFISFLVWHGAFERPLTETEIREFFTPIVGQLPGEAIDLANMSLDEFATYLAELQSTHPEQSEDVKQLETFLTFLREDDGKPIVMVNLLDLHEAPNDENGDSFEQTSEDALEDYGRVVFSFLIQRGSYPIFSGNAAMNVMETWGIENAEEWTSATLVRYRSRRVMLELTSDASFNASHHDKVAGIEKTIGLPTGIDLATGDLSLTMGLLLLSAGLGTQLLINRRKSPH